jgi:adenylate kinase
VKNIVLIGPPGSGKGTLSKKLQEIGYLQISTGDLLREEVATGSELGKKIAEKIDNGFMVEDEISLAVMKKAMKTAKSGSIFDGYPRNLSQAKLLEQHLHTGDLNDLIILFLKLDLDDIKERIIFRKTCADCGEIFNLKTKKPKLENEEEVCTKCGSHNLQKRSDDNEESLQNRFTTYLTKTYPVVEMYEHYPKFFEIQAFQNEEQIWNDVYEIIKD